MKLPLSDRLISRVSVAASIGLAVTLSASVGAVVWPRVAVALGVKPTPPPPAYAAGDRVDVPASWYAKAPQTLIVFARANCGACQTAQPFLKSLAGTVTAGGGAVVVAGHRETPGEDAEYTRSLGLSDSAFVVFPKGLRVRVTPTLVLVDRTGLILHAWEAVGPPERQHEIATAVEAAFPIR